MNRQHFAVAILFLLMSLEFCNATWCFVCHSDNDDGCGDKFRISTSDTDKRSQCPGSCIKRRGKRKRGSVSRTEIYRSCIAYGSEGCYTEMWNGIEQYTCLCNTDFCNGSPDYLQQSYLLIAGVPLAFFAAKYLYL
ncbi:casein kinase II subunit beta [Elysia marginata]|uniref:Casein kinase II subunit beta n=1 Tax=Elysia marginata TaxID=1093978 RepID=A0AAV4EZZ3_9GAST|nr:casein kinase II subunit beta [Elysia marginata]